MPDDADPSRGFPASRLGEVDRCGAAKALRESQTEHLRRGDMTDHSSWSHHLSRQRQRRGVPRRSLRCPMLRTGPEAAPFAAIRPAGELSSRQASGACVVEGECARLQRRRRMMRWCGHGPHRTPTDDRLQLSAPPKRMLRRAHPGNVSLWSREGWVACSHAPSSRPHHRMSSRPISSKGAAPARRLRSCRSIAGHGAGSEEYVRPQPRGGAAGAGRRQRRISCAARAPRRRRPARRRTARSHSQAPAGRRPRRRSAASPPVPTGWPSDGRPAPSRASWRERPW